MHDFSVEYMIGCFQICWKPTYCELMKYGHLHVQLANELAVKIFFRLYLGNIRNRQCQGIVMSVNKLF